MKAFILRDKHNNRLIESTLATSEAACARLSKDLESLALLDEEGNDNYEVLPVVMVSLPDDLDPSLIEAFCEVATRPSVARAIAERARQIEQEGWSKEHDDHYQLAELEKAAACYALACDAETHEKAIQGFWPWLKGWWKPSTKSRNREKATALLLAASDHDENSSQ